MKVIKKKKCILNHEIFNTTVYIFETLYYYLMEILEKKIC